MKALLTRLFYGRNGQDHLGRFLYFAALALCIVAMVSGWAALYYLGAALLVWCMFRMFSRNLAKRQQENRAYLSYRYRLTGRFAGFKSRMQQSKTHRFYKCPACKQRLRLPRGKGRLSVTCPKCHANFEKKS